MPDETVIEDAAIDALVDEALGASPEGEQSSDESIEETEGNEEEEQRSAPDITKRLETLGLGKDVTIPEDLSPEAVALLDRVVAKADARIRGFQSGFQKQTRDYEAKASVYDQLVQMPEFNQWVEDFKAGRLGKPVETEPELDLEKLPTDPMQRLEAIVTHIVTKTVGKQFKGELEKVRGEVGSVGEVMRGMVWQNFVAQNPDAANHEVEIRRLLHRGHTLPEAYKYAKGATVDEKSIEDKVLEKVKAKIAEKKKASGAVLSQHRPKGSKASDDIPVPSGDKGRRASLFAALEKADKKLGVRYGEDL